jgi:DNA-binding transcriptional regulator YhcF (GntR family)
MTKYFYRIIIKNNLASSKKEAIELARATAWFVKQAKKMDMTLDELSEMIEEQMEDEKGEFGFGGDWWKQ